MTTLYCGLDDRLLVATGHHEWEIHEGLVGHDFECVGASPAAPDRVFAGTVEHGLQRSTDGGKTWERSLDTDDRVTAVTVSPHDPDVVWAGTEPSRVYRSADGGDSWTEREGIADLPSASRWSFPPRPDTHHVRWIAVHPTDPDRLYVAVEAGAFVRTTDGGETWQDHPEGARRDNHTVATHPADPDRVYVAAGDGYAESPDAGDTWTYPQTGLDHGYVWGLAVDPADPDAVVVSAARSAYAAHDPDGESYVYRRVDGSGGRGSTDGDDSGADGDRNDWQRAMDGLPGPEGIARPLLAANESGDGTRFFALTNHGIYHSTAGWSWDRLPVEWRDAYREQLPRGVAVV